MKKKLVIFDCDGVLIDSEIIIHQVGSAELTRLGFPLSVSRSIELFSGVADEELPKVIQREYGRPIAASDLEAFANTITRSIQANLKPIPGITKVIEYLDQQALAKCVASNATHDHLIRSFAATGLDVYFKLDHIFSIAMVKRGKPMPDIFLYAANQFQVDAADCLVIEDSVVGIKAAKAADMTVIGFLGGSHSQHPSCRERVIAAEPDLVANDAEELLEKLSDYH